MSRLTFEERRDKTSNPLLKKLFQVILDKKTTLCVAADIGPFDRVVRLVDSIGEHICILKVHTEWWGLNMVDNLETLYALKKKHNFLLFEDRKFNDLEVPTSAFYRNYIKYADLVTVEISAGDTVLRAIENGIKEANLPEDEPRGCLSVCEYSSAGQMLQTKPIYDMSKKSSACVGIIAQTLQIDDPCAMIKASPGIHLSLSTDGGRQQWRAPDDVVAGGTDIVIVGRGIVSAPEDQWTALACQYKDAAYEAYLRAIS